MAVTLIITHFAVFITMNHLSSSKHRHIPLFRVIFIRWRSHKQSKPNATGTTDHSNIVALFVSTFTKHSEVKWFRTFRFTSFSLEALGRWHDAPARKFAKTQLRKAITHRPHWHANRIHHGAELSRSHLNAGQSRLLKREIAAKDDRITSCSGGVPIANVVAIFHRDHPRR